MKGNLPVHSTLNTFARFGVSSVYDDPEELLAREKLELLPSLLTALLEPHQQALSQPLVETISEALQGCSIGDGPVVHRKVCAVLDLARQQQYV